MDIKLTITVVLKDENWGFSDLLHGRTLNGDTAKEVKDLISEDYSEVFGNPDSWIIEEMKTVPKTNKKAQVKRKVKSSGKGSKLVK